MNKQIKIALSVYGIMLAIVFTFSFALPAIGARSQYGMPGIYNATALNLSNEEGAALALDSSGHLIMSTTTVVSVSFSNSSTTTIPYAIQVSKPTGTSTIQAGTSVKGHGGCLALASGKTNEALYVFVLDGPGGLYLATSTRAADCY